MIIVNNSSIVFSQLFFFGGGGVFKLDVLPLLYISHICSALSVARLGSGVQTQQRVFSRRTAVHCKPPAKLNRLAFVIMLADTQPSSLGRRPLFNPLPLLC